MDMLVALLIAWLPGIIAEIRKHRHAMLVSMLGFVGLWIHPLLWVLALLWAWRGPSDKTG